MDSVSSLVVKRSWTPSSPDIFFLSSSLDNQGTEDFLRLLNTLTEKTNAFIISHKGDQLYDKFEEVIRFEKHKNFSRIAVT